MGGVPSIPTDRSKTVQVIGAGYSRTGTMSMALALETLLDGPVMHGGTHLLGREDEYLGLWARIYENQADRALVLKLLREATAGFVAVTDVPCNHFLPELLELYPDAVVVSVTRDPQAWLKSMETIHSRTPPWLGFLLYWCPGWRWMPYMFDRMGAREDLMMPATTEGAERLLLYDDYVRRITPPEKYHRVELRDGWAPLCKILGKPVPEKPFPRANEKEAAEKVGARVFKIGFLTWGAVLASLSVAGWASWRLLGSTRA